MEALDRGGGKSWAARIKAVLLALNYSGIQILLLRRTLSELRENHIIPLLSILNGVARYRDISKEFIFPNGSRIVLGYCDSERDVLQYQGQAYDVIFMEEATLFTEFQFQSLTESNRSSGIMKEKFSPRMYFTCNPGGVGHEWVKRLFIDKLYRNSERSEDYTFIPSTVYENKFLMDNSPDYVRTLENLPEKRKKAMLYGDWDIFDGQYFSEFKRELHTCKPFEIKEYWDRYVTIDYGMDMLAVLWIAVDTVGKAYVYRELYEGKDNGKGENGQGHIVSEAVKRIKEFNGKDNIKYYLAPPDLFNRNRDTGKSTAEIFMANGISLFKTSNNRVNGWRAVREYLKPYKGEQGETTADIAIFENCVNLIRCLPAVQFDDKNPEDVADQPHEITHICDALRGFCVTRTTSTVKRSVEQDFISANFKFDNNETIQETENIVI